MGSYGSFCLVFCLFVCFLCFCFVSFFWEGRRVSFQNGFNQRQKSGHAILFSFLVEPVVSHSNTMFLIFYQT